MFDQLGITHWYSTPELCWGYYGEIHKIDYIWCGLYSYSNWTQSLNLPFTRDSMAKHNQNRNSQPISVSKDRTGSSTTENNQRGIKTMHLPWCRGRIYACSERGNRRGHTNLSRVTSIPNSGSIKSKVMAQLLKFFTQSHSTHSDIFM